MPRNGSGNYSLPESPFVPNTTISSAAVNSDFSDIATALTGSIAADGQTTITGALRHASGISLLPGQAFAAEPSTGFFFKSTGVIGVSTAGEEVLDISLAQFDATGNPFIFPSGYNPNPVGMIMDWPGTTAPSGWLFPFGQVLSQTTYAALFAVLGTMYNTGGEGAGNFRMPDLRGRASFGRDDMGGSAANRITNANSGIVGTTLGANGGSPNVTISQANLPAVTLNTAIASGQGPHVHGSQTAGEANGTTVPFGAPGSIPGFNIGGVPATLPAMTGTTPLGGSGTALITMPPALILNKIIFTGVV